MIPLTIGECITIASFLLAAAALFFNLRQQRVDVRRKRAEFIVSLLTAHLDDAVALDMFYDLEYGRFSYGDSFHGSQDERRLDRLLSFFEKVAAVYQLKLITYQDLKVIGYDLVRVYTNDEVKKYFVTLDSLPFYVGAPVAFTGFRKIGALLASDKDLIPHKSSAD